MCVALEFMYIFLHCIGTKLLLYAVCEYVVTNE